MAATFGDDDSATTVRVMRLRFPGTCDVCGAALTAGTRAGYLRATATVRCLTCLASQDPRPQSTSAIDVAHETAHAGTAGGSARREYERRAARREARIRRAHPRLGGLILALGEEPQSTTAWARGARGEELLGARLDRLTAHGVQVLHDRRIPGSRANIDHIAVSSTGVHVIDAKRYTGRPALRVEGGILRPRVERLVVGSRDRTRLVEGIHRQVGLVRAALDAAELPEVPVHGTLCFLEADWPLIGGSFVIADVAVTWPKKLAERLVAPGPVEDTQPVYRALSRAFPPA